jgi:hypothetical protein
MNPIQRKLKFGVALGAAALLFAAAGCDSVLETEPVDQIAASSEITDASTAQAALNGAYDAMQSSGIYGLYMEAASALASDEAEWAGTFQYLGDMDVNRITADNGAVSSIWNALYVQIDRDNTILARVPTVDNIPPAVRDEVMGEAYFLRALSFHNLVKYFGGVPMPLTPVSKPGDAASYTRASVSDMYTQILSDLDQAAKLISNTTDTRRATKMAVQAIRARVLLYRASLGGASAAADYQGALDAANVVLAGRDTLTVPYASMFTATGANTAEDIFRIAFTSSETNGFGNYFLASGRFEAAATTPMYHAFEAGDLRQAASFKLRPNETDKYQSIKYPTTQGTEHPHVIRLAEVVLIKAEALARLGQLQAAVNEYNKVRIRAGLPKHVLGVDVKTADDIVKAIDQERRVELSFEGDRWPNMVRRGTVVATMGIQDRAFQALFPIPLTETTTNPNLTQNPGY